MKIKMKKKSSSEKTNLADDIREAVAELKLVRQGKLETRDARDLIDKIQRQIPLRRVDDRESITA